MEQSLTILIVEDETPLAEMHAEFIRHFPGCATVWLAGNLAQAREMITRFKPTLILLDNYLPDGKGITLLHELSQARFTGGVVFTTAASDMDTVSDAVRCGVFDYLVKPIAYERLGQTLVRFQQRMAMVSANASASQRQIDEMFNAYARGKPKEALPPGIDALTLAKVQQLFADPHARHTAETVADELKLSRTTARRYLEFAASRQQIVAEIIYGKVGRPQRTYRAL
ncbi:two-component response regulator DpiA [Atlantibacter hermannii]|uniref:two-component response regulator DpiA n=1 Tax=Atlantibacter hermannii TaxID=565 RepID=UPI0005C24BBB|nr:two-component response regulator DpiA [Atlantibacter hermannii]KIU34007.1 two-component response regulator DpiA [Atlantibacter hermannii]